MGEETERAPDPATDREVERESDRDFVALTIKTTF